MRPSVTISAAVCGGCHTGFHHPTYDEWLQAGHAAFIASGTMAVAYFMAHAPGGFWPIANHGELAVVYCFVFLYIAARGSGRLSVDALARGRRS